MNTRQVANSPVQSLVQSPPPTWGVTPVSDAQPDAPSAPVRTNANGQRDPQIALNDFLERLDETNRRLKELHELMMETIRHYYWVNGLLQGRQYVYYGIHELLFPKYFKPVTVTCTPKPVFLPRPVQVRIDVHACRPRPATPPLVAPHARLAPPLAPVPVSVEQLAKLPPAPLPRGLKETLKRAIATPYDPQEAGSFFFEANRNVTPQQIQWALDVLPEIEASLGMALGKTFNGHFGTVIDVRADDGFEKLAAERIDQESSATGAYLFALATRYMEYKAEYYGLSRAISRDLYHRDPCSHKPRVHMEDALAYLEKKYAPTLEGLLWRTVRTSSPIMLDLDGDGALSVTGKSTAKERAAGNGFVATGSVRFDLDGDGRKERIEWMAGDGMLVDDRDGGATAAALGNGEISGKRLFGDEGGRYANGYEKLKTLDMDGDGVLRGSELDGLKVWVDNGDAKLEAHELHSLRDLGISEIDTRMTLTQNAQGESLMRSTFVQNGETKVSEDVWFARG